MKKIKKTLRKLLIKSGIPIYSATVRWPHDEGFNDVRRRVKARGVEGIPDDRCFTLYKAAQSVAHLDGQLAECGCRKGKSTRFILAGTGIESDKQIHVFDSFEGLSAPRRKDKLNTGNHAWREGALASSEDVLVNNLQMYEHMLVIHKGWIPERFKDIEKMKFSFLHVDVDLYDPTLDSLKFFYDRMTTGGIIMCDDYGSVSCPGAKKAFDEFFADKQENILELPSAQAIVVKA